MVLQLTKGELFQLARELRAGRSSTLSIKAETLRAKVLTAVEASDMPRINRMRARNYIIHGQRHVTDGGQKLVS